MFQILSATFDGAPVPYTRMTQRSMYADPAAKRYLDYRNRLAQDIRKRFPTVCHDFKAMRNLPDWKTLRKSLLSEYFFLEVMVYPAQDRGDLSNFFKMVEDALQMAGVIYDDKRIVRIKGSLRIDRECPRVSFTLSRLELLSNEN